VIKTNANQRYTSNAQTTFLIRAIAKKAGIPVQEFEIRNDSVSRRVCHWKDCRVLKLMILV